MTVLVETLFLKLGPAIAKTILAIWTKDSDLGPNFTADAVDDFLNYFHNKTDDIVAQRRGARQFVDIGERVADSLQPIFELEKNQMDDESRNSVALAVADTLKAVEIDVKILAERNLDPSRLSEYLIESYPLANTGFSESEIVLYKRIIRQCSQYIIDISTRLPNFTERTFSEVLKRDQKILDIVNQILSTVKDIRDASRQKDKDELREYFEVDYRRNVERKMGKIQIIGLQAALSSTKYGLSIAYITLSVNQFERFRDDESNFITVDKVLLRSNRMLLLGAPGSGKTTLLQWIAVRAATNSFPEELSYWNHKVPFFIKLREFAQVKLPSPQDFVQHIAPSIAHEMPSKWVNDLLRSGRAIVLVDGVDELPEFKRVEVRNWIEELVDNFPKAHYVVTSRPYAATSSWLVEQNFISANLQKMSLETIDEFITRWHKAVREELVEESDKKDIFALETNLKQIIHHNFSIRSLATNPLLCAMLCALHRERRQQLPTRRSALYEAACRMLLEERDKIRNILSSSYTTLDYEQKRMLLQKLAYWMLRNKQPQINRADVEHQFKIGLRSLQNLPKDATPQAIYLLFVERSGIVREPEVDVLDFIHRTFLEYLAALAIVDERDIGVLKNNATDEQWREVIILVSSIADAVGRKDLINDLIKQGDDNKRNSASLYLLAAACSESTIELNPEIQEVVQQRLKEVVPPKNSSDVYAIASAGTLAAPFLIVRNNYSIETRIMCIQTLAQIGTDLAMNALATYRSDRRKMVIKEIVKSWKSFDRNEYVKRVLSNFKELIFSGDIDIYHFDQLVNAESIVISNNPIITNINSIKNLHKLRRLEIINCGSLENIDALYNLVNLQYLTLKDCQWVGDFSPLGGLKNLKKLVISEFTLQENISFLRAIYPDVKIVIDKKRLLDDIDDDNFL